MNGTRVGLLHGPNLPEGHRLCWRCGASFRWKYQHLTEDAPCTDCREILAAEGSTKRYNTRPLLEKTT